MTSKLQKEFIAYTKFYLKWAGKIILLNDYQFLSTCLKFSSPQLISLILIVFFYIPFQDLPNSNYQEKTSRQNKVYGKPDFFPICAQTMWSMNMTNPTSCWGESHRYRVVCICAARHSKTLNSQLEAETKHIWAGESMPHVTLQPALGVPGLHLLW